MSERSDKLQTPRRGHLPGENWVGIRTLAGAQATASGCVSSWEKHPRPLLHWQLEREHVVARNTGSQLRPGSRPPRPLSLAPWERSERRIMRPQLAPGPDTPTQWLECARGGPMERLGLYPGAGGTAGCVPQEDEWGGRGRRRGQGGPGRRASSEDAEGEQNMERWEKRGCRPCRCCLGVGWGETPEAGRTAPAPSARSPVLTLVCAPHGFQSNSPK